MSKVNANFDKWQFRVFILGIERSFFLNLIFPEL